jgi:hypothetical protein
MRAWGARCAICGCLLIVRPISADEIRLKDGSKIIGTVVAVENGSYKVQTSYGYAMIEKEKIASIIPASLPAKDSKTGDKENKPALAATTDDSKKSDSVQKPLPAGSQAELTAKSGATPAVQAANQPAPNGPSKKSLNGAGPVSTAQAPNGASAAASSLEQIAPPQPAAKPEPEPIHETVDGNLYVNQTFGFRLYKPPSWDLIPDARAALESTIAALGTYDETTLMVIARETLQGTLEKHADSTQQRVRTAYENFRIISTRAGSVAGAVSNERHYRGVIDGHEWSGVIVTFGRGSDVYTILGATRAESDLVQIQENVIARTIASLQFEETTSHR